jgi:hypothetical protein
MIQMAAKCPKCGANHNPLVHPSLRREPADLPDDELAPLPGTTAFTWLCETCGETYRLDIALDDP